MIRKLLAAAALAVCLVPCIALAQDAGDIAPAVAPAAGSGLFDWLSTHATPIGWALGAWVLLASLVNKSLWPKPIGPGWAVVLHTILIDLPAFLPSVNFRGIFGLPITIPFLTLSGQAKPPAAALVLFLGAGAVGCATFNDLYCGKGKHTTPPDAKACAFAFLEAAGTIPRDVLACTQPISAACIDAVLATGAELAPCKPGCADNVSGNRVSTRKVATNVLRANVVQSLRASGYPEAGK